ncbi:hypothetical protein BS47DRAFT_1102295 [Hydnum rufescens UP504]|uniref:Protein kinase domain-containing protein n=1 Tax=Hydnum rufescens UP504 TaxID=1448309 RepID=A0A9P6AUL0_9AGAM|nr:hypothetical protein BS47DRAFT_1102295 [Hydnum rufescens UP504]
MNVGIKFSRLKREALVWKSLNHVNIVPLFGFISGKLGPGLVSPWYSKGNVHQYVQRVPHVRREPLCEDVARGLRYLHEHDPPIIHGDLKGANVLVALNGRAALCDFGLSVKLDGDPTGFTSSAIGGTLRFMTYEQLNGNPGFRSPSGDTYAYACTYGCQEPQKLY